MHGAGSAVPTRSRGASVELSGAGNLPTPVGGLARLESS